MKTYVGNITFKKGDAKAVEEAFRNNGLDDPEFLKKCTSFAEAGDLQYEIGESFTRFCDDPEKFLENSFEELKEKGILIDVVVSVDSGYDGPSEYRVRNGELKLFADDELAVIEASTEELVAELRARNVTVLYGDSCAADREKIFREVEFEDQMQDAEENMRNFCNDDFDFTEMEIPEIESAIGMDFESICKDLVERYHKRSDTNVAERTIWQSTIESLLKEKTDKKKGGN